jgi:hypothetical protein
MCPFNLPGQACGTGEDGDAQVRHRGDLADGNGHNALSLPSPALSDRKDETGVGRTAFDSSISAREGLCKCTVTRRLVMLSHD